MGAGLPKVIVKVTLSPALNVVEVTVVLQLFVMPPNSQEPSDAPPFLATETVQTWPLFPVVDDAQPDRCESVTVSGTTTSTVPLALSTV